MAKRRRGKDVIRYDDSVVILKPRYVRRWGYPLSFEEVLQDLHRTHSKELQVVYDTFGLKDGHFTSKKIASAIAYALLHKYNFGGDQRSLFFEPLDKEVVGKICRIYDIKYVNTGTYAQGYGCWSDREGYYDYEPPYLADVKRHKLVRVFAGFMAGPVWLHADDVEKVHDAKAENVIVVDQDGKEHRGAKHY